MKTIASRLNAICVLRWTWAFWRVLFKEKCLASSWQRVDLWLLIMIATLVNWEGPRILMKYMSPSLPLPCSFWGCVCEREGGEKVFINIHLGCFSTSSPSFVVWWLTVSLGVYFLATFTYSIETFFSDSMYILDIHHVWVFLYSCSPFYGLLLVVIDCFISCTEAFSFMRSQ